MVVAHTSHKDILKKRSDFLNAAKGHYLPRGAFVMQRNKQIATCKPRVGFTVTKKVGNAVVRNRVKRRLREAIRYADNYLFEISHDYVLVGRTSALSVEFDTLCADIETALKKLARGEGKPARPRKNQSSTKPNTGQ